MFSILIINLLLGHFDNKLFFDEEYIKFLKYKNSFIQIKHQTIEPNYKFYKRITPEYKVDNKIKLFEITPKVSIFAKRDYVNIKIKTKVRLYIK